MIEEDIRTDIFFSRECIEKFAVVFPINSDFLELEDLEQSKDKLTCCI